MDPKPDLIREDIDETRSALTEKLETLEGQLRGTVESAKQTVEGTIENVKDSIRHLSPAYQTTQHPFAMVGGAVATGILAGRLFQNRRSARARSPMPWIGEERGAPELYVHQNTSEARETESGFPRTSEYEEPSERRFAAPPPPSKPAGPSLLERFADEFQDEIQMVKGMVLKGVLDATADLVKRSVPAWTEQVDQVVGSVAQKLTDQPRVSSRGERTVDSTRQNRSY